MSATHSVNSTVSVASVLYVGFELWRFAVSDLLFGFHASPCVR